MQNKTAQPLFLFSVSLHFTLLFALFAGILFLAPQPGQAADRVTICFGSASSALLPIARDKGFFKEEGVEVEMLSYTSGRDSIQAMLDGKCDLSTTAQTPVVHHSLNRRDFLILANLSYATGFEKILVRNDRGINGPADLRGRRVALPQFATQHYLLDTYLIVHGLNPQEVPRLYLPHKDAYTAFQQGKVDALVYREPEVTHLLAEFTGRARLLPSDSIAVSAYLLVGRRDFVDKNPAAIKRILRGLIKAEEYARKEPRQARAIAARIYGANQEEIEKIWSLHRFHISLDQSLLAMLESMARWEIGLSPADQQKTMPNYLDFFYLDALKEVRPKAVNIIH